MEYCIRIREKEPEEDQILSRGCCISTITLRYLTEGQILIWQNSILPLNVWEGSL